MKKLRTMLVILLLSIATTPVMSSSDNHAGLYIAVEAATNGAAMNGSGTNSNDEITNGTIGEVFESVGLHVGYLFPASDTFLIGLDITLMPGDGAIKLDAGAGDSNSDDDDITLDFGDVITGSIVPTFAVTDNSAIYGKYGISRAGLSWAGNVDTTLNSYVDGETYAIGTRTQFDNGAFLQTEFGYSDFDTINVSVTTGGTGKANPERVYGAFALGVRF